MLPMRRAGTSARPGRSSENHAGDGEIPIPLGVADRQQQSELRLFVPRELNGFSGRSAGVDRPTGFRVDLTLE